MDSIEDWTKLYGNIFSQQDVVNRQVLLRNLVIMGVTAVSVVVVFSLFR